MPLTSRLFDRKALLFILLCILALLWGSIILCHELSLGLYLQSYNDGTVLNTTWECISSNTEKSYRSMTFVNAWCRARRVAGSDFVHHMVSTVLQYCDYDTIRAVYYYYLSSLVITTTFLSVIIFQNLCPMFTQFPVIFIVYSFVTWRPVSTVILSSIGYQIFKHSPNLLRTFETRPWLLAFVSLATFKFLKVVIHTASFYLLTNPAKQPVNPTLSPKDVTVVVPSIGDFDAEFIECLETIVVNRPHQIIVSTVGPEKFNKATEIKKNMVARHPDANIQVVMTAAPNKRTQFLQGLEESTTEITAYADDHVFWPPTFLRSTLAPFEDQRVGLVGTVKKVRRDRSGGFWRSFMNYIACLYLERHNFECTASYNLDGGVFVISGRTALTRTKIMQEVKFREEFLGETWWWGQVGPLKVDDDNCITRWMVKNGWKTVFHNAPDAVVEISLGTVGGLEKFRGQLIRWVRSTLRSNSTSLLSERDCWTVHPWTTYAMFISSFVNIALIYDPLLVFTLYRSGYTQHLRTLLLALLVSKLIKPIEHLRKEPRDILTMLSLGLLFGYVHSIFKIWAYFTAGNIGWTGRKGI